MITIFTWYPLLSGLRMSCITQKGILRWMDMLGRFYASFYKGDNFYGSLFCFLKHIVLSEGFTMEGENLGANSFPLEKTPFQKGGMTKIDNYLLWKYCHSPKDSLLWTAKFRYISFSFIQCFFFFFFFYQICIYIFNSPLTLVLLNPDIPYICKQCRSRSVGFWIWICTVCH